MEEKTSVKKKNSKNSIIIITLVAVLAAAGVIYFMNNNSNNNGSNPEETSEKSSKGKCSVLKCMEKLNAEMTVEEINEVIGFEGTKKNETDSYVVYEWDITDDTGINAQFHTKYNTATISANYPSSMIKKTADFSKWKDIQAKIKTKESLKYDEFVEMVGGVEGVIKQITNSSTSYSWENADGGYLTGYFNKDNKCTMATGRF